LRRPALRVPRGPRPVHPEAPRSDRRRDGRRRGGPRLCPHPADTRAAHPAREGDVEHHHQPDPPRPGGPGASLPAPARGAPPRGGDLHGPRRLREGATRGARGNGFVPRTDNIQGVCRRRRTERGGRDPRRAGRRRQPRLCARTRLPRSRERLARRGHREAHDRRDRPPRCRTRPMKLIYEKSKPGRRGLAVPRPDLPIPAVPPEAARAEPPRLPEIAEPEVLRHFTALSTRNFGVDTGFYPLGSCTMKYNPRVNERLVGIPGFRDLHPLVDDDAAQGALELEWRL